VRLAIYDLPMATTAIQAQSNQVPSGYQAHQVRRGENALLMVLPAALLLYSALMPNELRLSIADLSLYAPRVMGFLLLPWILFKVVRTRFRFQLWDYLFLFAAFWMLFSFMIYYDPLTGLVRGGALAFDAVIPYLVGRICIRSPNDFRRFLVLAAPALFLAGLIMLAEVIASRALIRPFFASIFGELSTYENGIAVGRSRDFIDYRLGILRAAGPFSHPILAGVVLASFLPLYWLSGVLSWPRHIGITASLFAILSASSAAFLGLILGFGMLFADYAQRVLVFVTWRLMIIGLAALVTLVHFASSGGIVNVVVGLTLNPATGRFRRLIWEYGLISVEKNPWIGIGFTNYERLDWMVQSVDAHWLLLAIRHGWMPPVFMLVVVIATLTGLGLSSVRSDETDRRLRVGMAISLFMVTLIGFTVSFFGGAETWVYLLLAMSLSIATAPIMRPLHLPRPAPRPRPRLEPVQRRRNPRGRLGSGEQEHSGQRGNDA